MHTIASPAQHHTRREPTIAERPAALAATADRACSPIGAMAAVLWHAFGEAAAMGLLTPQQQGSRARRDR